jgi:hypothetical protein
MEIQIKAPRALVAAARRIDNWMMVPIFAIGKIRLFRLDSFALASFAEPQEDAECE